MQVFQEILITIALLVLAGALLGGFIRWKCPDYGLHVAIMILSADAYFIWLGLMPYESPTWIWGVFFTAGTFSAALTIIITKILTDKMPTGSRAIRHHRKREDLIWWMALLIMGLELIVFYTLLPGVISSGWLLTHHLELPSW